VVAESYARIFYRNSINVGLLPVECKVDVDEGDELTIDLVKDRIKNLRTGKEWSFPPFPPFVRELIDGGGLMAKIKEAKRCSK
jgi:3-isopropylmalate dehydratase small subunit